jgi:hypothetical protein
MHPRERNLAIPRPVTLVAPRCRPPSPSAIGLRGSVGGAFPGRVRSLTSYVTLEAPPSSGLMPTVASAPHAPTRADTHGGLPREPSPHVRWLFRPFVRMNRTSPSYRSGALPAPSAPASRACDRPSMLMRAPLHDASLQWPTTLRSLVTSPAGTVWHVHAIHEEPSSWSRQRPCCHVRSPSKG